MINYRDVRSYYASKFGLPDREAVFRKDDFSVGVLKWRVSDATEGVNFYATVGASDYPVPGCEDTHRREFFVAVVPEFDDIASPLARLGIYAQLTGKSIDVGHTYRASQGLTESSDFSGFVILDPLGDFPKPIQLASGRHVEFLMAVPLHGDELDYAASRGVNNLLGKMEESSARLWDPRRRSVFESGSTAQ